jgi:hypothetical protein
MCNRQQALLLTTNYLAWCLGRVITINKETHNGVLVSKLFHFASKKFSVMGDGHSIRTLENDTDDDDSTFCVGIPSTMMILNVPHQHHPPPVHCSAIRNNKQTNNQTTKQTNKQTNNLLYFPLYWNKFCLKMDELGKQILAKKGLGHF